MLALLLVSALAVVTPNPIAVGVDATIVANVDISPSTLIYGGTFRAEDPGVALVSGRMPVNGSVGEATVTGLRVGETRLIVTYVSGLSVWTMPLARIVVGDPCEPPQVLLTTDSVRVADTEAASLQVVTLGSSPMTVTWYDGAVPIGTGNPLLVTLPRGVYRLSAQATNRCGMAVSGPLVVEVVAPRRRSARH